MLNLLSYLFLYVSELQPQLVCYVVRVFVAEWR